MFDLMMKIEENFLLINKPKYQKPTQPIYRPPSARIESSMSGPNLSSSSSASFIPTSLQVGGNHPSDIFLIKQPSTSFGNVISSKNIMDFVCIN